ncbi:MAG TPA: SpoIIE family protein phosphatase [Aldersonia sp.]
MTSSVEAFRAAYRTALQQHLSERDEASLTAGLDLGRRALSENVSILEVAETHFRLLTEFGIAAGDTAQRETAESALQFLLQTLTVLDIASRGFLGTARSYFQQRERADELSEQHAFQRALVESLQDGFLVADAQGTVVEVNAAFGELTGYGHDGLPYHWPHPWLPTDEADRNEAVDTLSHCIRNGGGLISVPIRHRDGHAAWLAVNLSSLTGSEQEPVFVGTIRDVTADRVAAEREQAAAHLATAIGAAASVADVITIGLNECRTAIDARWAMAAVWTDDRDDPDVLATGTEETAWSTLDHELRETLDRARRWSPLTMDVVHARGAAPGIVISLSATADAALWLEAARSASITPADRTMMTLLASHLTLALQRARTYDRARIASLTLQRAMLGEPDIPAGFAARYEPSEPPLEIGGDWYDVVRTGDGTVGVIVGDCVGRGLPAAAVMGQLRSSARALFLHGNSPGALLDDLDIVAAHTPGATCTTVCAAIVDPARGVLRYSSAGHMPTLLAAPGVGWRLLDEATAVPLATYDRSPRPEATVELPPGSTVLFYTDGLVERRGGSVDTAVHRAGDLLADAGALAPDAVADLVLSTFRPDVGYEDDVAVMVYRQPPPPLRIETEADPAELSAVRRDLRGWLAAAAVPADSAADIVCAVNEACTNSIEHAYHGRHPGHLAVTATVEVAFRTVSVTVADTGSWRPTAARERRGRGIDMMRAMSGSVDIDRSETGTCVRMTTTLADPTAR